MIKSYNKAVAADELELEPYLLYKYDNIDAFKYNDNLESKISQTKAKLPNKYHQFLKNKIIEYESKFPDISKKQRLKLIIEEWHKNQ